MKAKLSLPLCQTCQIAQIVDFSPLRIGRLFSTNTSKLQTRICEPQISNKRKFNSQKTYIKIWDFTPGTLWASWILTKNQVVFAFGMFGNFVE
jgi:hypothetical protein